MKIALVMEWSTAARNEIVFDVLKKVAEPKGYTVVNYGQFNAEDYRQTYVQNAIFLATLLKSGAADFVVTGCGTGEGATLAANAMPGVCCGLVIDPADSFLFTQINGGNCMSLAFAKGWGWAAEVNLEYIFEKFFAKEPEVHDMVVNAFGGTRIELFREHCKDKEILKIVEAVLAR